MKTKPVVNCTLIIRSQAEYSDATQKVVLRCLLEEPATGQHHGFTDVDALLAALRLELMKLQTSIIPYQPNSKNTAEIGNIPAPPIPTSLTNADQ